MFVPFATCFSPKEPESPSREGFPKGVSASQPVPSMMLTGEACVTEKVWKVPSCSVPGKIVRVRIPANAEVEQPLQSDMLATQNSFESLNWKFQLLSNARQSIEFSPNFCGDIQFQTCLLKIEKQLEKFDKLKVHVLMSPDFLKDEEIRLLNQLQSKFSSRFYSLISDRKFLISPIVGTQENHEKLLIVDEKYFVLGGSGVSASMCTKGTEPPSTHQAESLKDRLVSRAFRDMDVVGKGALAKQLRVHFFKHFLQWEKNMGYIEARNRCFPVDGKTACEIESLEEEPLLIKNVSVSPLFSSPQLSSPFNPITREIYCRLLGANRKICIAQMNFNPDPSIRAALHQIKTQKHNVVIELISNSTNGTGPFSCTVFAQTNKKNYSLATLVHEYQVPQTLFHKKVITIDGRVTVIGSYNFSMKSACLDDEVAIFVDSEEFTSHVDEILHQDTTFSRKLSEIELKTAPLSVQTQIVGTFQQTVLARFF